MNVYQYLVEGKDSERSALLCLDRTYSYEDLKNGASVVTDFLLRSGGRTGDRALLIGEDGFFWVASYLGTLRAGMVAVPLPAKITQEELAYIVSSAEPRFAFVQSRHLHRVAHTVAGVQVICDRSTNAAGISSVFDVMVSQASGPGPEPVAVAPNDLAALMFTSGSTGRPRGVMVAARNIVANTESIVDCLGLSANDRVMAVLPFHYCFGTSLLHTHLRVGGSIVIEPRFLYPEVVLKRLRETECTGFAGVPSHYQILLRRSTIASTSFPRLRYVQQAGGHLAPAFIEELRSALPHTQVYVMYGQTEATARLSVLPPEILDSKRGSVGKAIPGVRLTVVDENGHPVMPGQTGEIVAEGENVALGYWRDEAESAKSFRNGKLHTGDLGTEDEDGFVFLTARSKDILKCGGKRVSCSYVEDVVLQCAEVVEAAVVGTPDEILGEAVKVFVVPRAGTEISEQVKQLCRAKLPPPLVPKEVEVISALPKNSSGKVLKSVLREKEARKLESNPVSAG